MEQIAPYVDDAAGLGRAPDREHWQAEWVELRHVLEEVRDNRGYPYGVE